MPIHMWIPLLQLTMVIGPTVHRPSLDQQVGTPAIEIRPRQIIFREAEQPGLGPPGYQQLLHRGIAQFCYAGKTETDCMAAGG